MTADRLDWVLSGIDRGRLNKFELESILRLEKKLPEDITRSVENYLEQIYRAKSR